MPCPKCRIALVSGNGKGKRNGGNGQRCLVCPKCGYVRAVPNIKQVNIGNPWGKFGRKSAIIQDNQIEG